MEAGGDDPDDSRETLRYLLAWFLAPLLVLSIASTKRGLYLLPIYPAAALLVGWWLARGVSRLALGLLFTLSLLIAAGTVVAQGMLPWRPGIAVPFIVAILVIAAPALRALQDRRAVRCALLCAAMTGAAWLVMVLHVVPEVVGRATSARSMAAAVRRHFDEGDRLALYDFPQGQMGGILFYSRLTLPNLRSAAELDAFLAGGGPVGAGPGGPAGSQGAGSSGPPAGSDRGAFVLMREHDHGAVAPRLATPTVVARRFEWQVRDPRGRSTPAILLLARAGIGDNAPGTTRRPPP